MARPQGSQLRALQVRLLELVLLCLGPQESGMTHTIPILATTTVLPLLAGIISRRLRQQDHREHTKHTPAGKCRHRFRSFHLMAPLLGHPSQEWVQDWMPELLEAESVV
jgi:hypothetical protein